MSVLCVVECGRPASGSYFCVPCWRQVPIEEQRALYQLAQTVRFEPNVVGHQRAFQLALDRAVKAVPA